MLGDIRDSGRVRRPLVRSKIDLFPQNWPVVGCGQSVRRALPVRPSCLRRGLSSHTLICRSLASQLSAETLLKISPALESPCLD